MSYRAGIQIPGSLDPESLFIIAVLNCLSKNTALRLLGGVNNIVCQGSGSINVRSLLQLLRCLRATLYFHGSLCTQSQIMNSLYQQNEL